MKPLNAAVPRTIEPISKVEQHAEDCDIPVTLYKLNVTVSREQCGIFSLREFCPQR